jgi:hypothetical protein
MTKLITTKLYNQVDNNKVYEEVESDKVYEQVDNKRWAVVPRYGR